MNACIPVAFILVAAWCATGCNPKTVEETLVATETWLEADVELLNAVVEGGQLRVTVQYGGGCAEHEFALESAGPLLKSLPPKQPLRLVHRTPGDPCRALIQEEHTFELNPWRGAPNGVTVILLEHWNEPLIYENN
jgi:hypothetical protein